MTTEVTILADSPLFRLVRRLADNKYWLGRRYAEWCTAAPTLESAVAAAAMAQDEIGHARSHYPLFRQFLGEDVEPEEQAQFFSMSCLDSPFRGWCDFVAANFLVDTALTTIYSAALDSSYDDLRNRARRITGEEEIHWLHARGWVRRLGAGNEAVVATMTASLDRIWPEVLMWFGEPEGHDLKELCAEKMVVSGSDELRRNFLSKLSPVLTALPEGERLLLLSVDELPWDRWDSERSRLIPASDG